jgi:hypothetical protein
VRRAKYSIFRYISGYERSLILRCAILVHDDAGVESMKRRKKTELFNVETIENMKLGWKVGRQVQQEILQKKLMECFLEPSGGRMNMARYPEAMQPMIEDFMRKAEKQIRLYGP